MSSLQSSRILKEGFLFGVQSVQPQNLIKKWFRREGDCLLVGSQKYPLTPTYVVGFGKAVAGMVPHIEDTLRDENGSSFLKEGIISVPHGFKDSQVSSIVDLSTQSIVQFYEGAKSNIPDGDAHKTTLKIVKLIKSLSSKDLLIVLVSGGGSALLSLPASPVTLDEKARVIRNLGWSGASITELNSVRKALSDVKGGKLALMTEAKIVSFILSDIVNSPVDMIASGPTVLEGDRQGLVPLQILEKYGICVSGSLKEALERKQPRHSPYDKTRVNNIVIGDNTTALESVKQYILAQNNAIPVLLTSCVQGNTNTIGKELATLAYSVLMILADELDNVLILSNLRQFMTEEKVEELKSAIKRAKRGKGPWVPVVLILGGETTVQVRGKGKGGRNQEMVLSCSLELEKLCTGDNPQGEITFLSGGTDGVDGPTDAAGAFTFYSNKNGETRVQVQEARDQGLSPETSLETNSSYDYFSKLSNGMYMLKTGQTGTNVMDIQMVYIQL